MQVNLSGVLVDSNHLLAGRLDQTTTCIQQTVTFALLLEHVQQINAWPVTGCYRNKQGNHVRIGIGYARSHILPWLKTSSFRSFLHPTDFRPTPASISMGIRWDPLGPIQYTRPIWVLYGWFRVKWAKIQNLPTMPPQNLISQFVLGSHAEYRLMHDVAW